MQNFRTFFEASDKRIDFISKKYNLPVAVIKTIDDMYTTGNGKYLDWIVGEVVNDRLTSEDTEKVQSLLKYFHKNKDKKTWKASKDINHYEVNTLAKAVIQHKKDNEENENIFNADGELSSAKGFKHLGSSSFQGREYDVWELTEYEVTEKLNLKDRTNWCVAYPKQWENYGPPFYLITQFNEEDSTEDPKYLFHPGKKQPTISPQLMDTEDFPAGNGIYTVLEDVGLDVIKMILKACYAATNEDIEELKKGTLLLNKQVTYESMLYNFYSAQTPRRQRWETLEPYLNTLNIASKYMRHTGYMSKETFLKMLNNKNAYTAAMIAQLPLEKNPELLNIAKEKYYGGYLKNPNGDSFQDAISFFYSRNSDQFQRNLNLVYGQDDDNEDSGYHANYYDDKVYRDEEFEDILIKVGNEDNISTYISVVSSGYDDQEEYADKRKTLYLDMMNRARKYKSTNTKPINVLGKGFKDYVEEMTDAKLEFLSKQYNISSHIISSMIVPLDPTNGKWVEWLIKQMIAKTYKPDEDAENVKATLTRFMEYRNKKEWGTRSKDINSYKTLSELSKECREVYTELLTDEEGNIKEGNGMQLLKKVGTESLWVLTDYEATKIWNLKDKTDWCIAYPKQWTSYGPPFYMYVNNDSPKLLFHPGRPTAPANPLPAGMHSCNPQLMDATDAPAAIEDVIMLEDFGLNIVELIRRTFLNLINVGEKYRNTLFNDALLYFYDQSNDGSKTPWPNAEKYLEKAGPSAIPYFENVSEPNAAWEESVIENERSFSSMFRESAYGLDVAAFGRYTGIAKNGDWPELFKILLNVLNNMKKDPKLVRYAGEKIMDYVQEVYYEADTKERRKNFINSIIYPMLDWIENNPDTFTTMYLKYRIGFTVEELISSKQKILTKREVKELSNRAEIKLGFPINIEQIQNLHSFVRDENARRKNAVGQ